MISIENDAAFERALQLPLDVLGCFQTRSRLSAIRTSSDLGRRQGMRLVYMTCGFTTYATVQPAS